MLFDKIEVIRLVADALVSILVHEIQEAHERSTIRAESDP